ncbi:glycosyltransferase family 17 protein [Bdellovibrio svalbardensis]|uniref:N-acetylglucosaminyltransferase n=1 Tax=Bdellovibrio svalbardensis TaxID=2972972 RepID=A0ABT6DQJ8_9BACT|nr:N-acetylglucosaminyltransferase [Bdellovibrio svalbardensis]MDG0818194.1 N-acetylglucosaminyltransferase [Bdellovibrio svalbardensis]
MIYDCFAFFNELDLLEIRLNTLDSVVDRFVLVEATRTFQKAEKPLFFEQNKERFKPFLHKIEHIVVDEYPGFFAKFRVPTTWDYDDHQKEQIKRGLKNCKPDDVIIISDVDEIPRPELVKQYADKPGIKVFQQRLYYYYLNCFIKKYPEPIEVYNGYMPWQGTVMLQYKDLKTVQKARLLRGERQGSKKVTIISEGGWHFSYLGGVKKVIEKIEAYAHTEHNVVDFKDPKRIEEVLRKGGSLYGQELDSEFVKIGKDFPQYLQDHKEKYQELILE